MNELTDRQSKEAELHRATEETQLFWEPVSQRRWGLYISSIEREAIELAINLAGPASVSLDIGAEGGRWSQLLADHGWRTICTDIQESALKICKQRIPNAECILVERGSSQFPCEAESLGMLLAIEVHELVEQSWFVREAERTLKVGGLFVGVFQNTRSWRAVCRNLMPIPDGSFKQYTASYAHWRRLAVQHGFQMVNETGICWMPFGRKSDSRLVPFAVTVEKRLGLRKLPTLSPWIVFVAQKR